MLAIIRTRILTGIVDYNELTEEDLADPETMLPYQQETDTIMKALFARRTPK